MLDYYTIYWYEIFTTTEGAEIRIKQISGRPHQLAEMTCVPIRMGTELAEGLPIHNE